MKEFVDFVKEWLALDSVKTALGVLVGYLISLVPVIPGEVKAALVALVLAAIGLYAGWKANRTLKLRRAELDKYVTK